MKTCFVLCIGMITLFAFLAASSPLEANQPRDTWVRSFAAGKKDSNGQFLGGSEVHHIVGHKGKLYAATGYWMDANNTYYSAGKRNQWAQILVKDSKDAPWKEEYDTSNDQGVLRPEVLKSVTFKRPNPDVNLLILATYRRDHTKYYVDIMVRNDATGKWTKTCLTKNSIRGKQSAKEARN